MSFKIYYKNIMNIIFFFTQFLLFRYTFLNLIIHFHEKEQTIKEKKRKGNQFNCSISPLIYQTQPNKQTNQNPSRLFKHPKTPNSTRPRPQCRPHSNPKPHAPPSSSADPPPKMSPTTTIEDSSPSEPP